MTKFQMTALALALSLVPTLALAQSVKGAEMSQQHRSQVAATVEKLTELAGKDKNIGEEIRQVAQEQQQVQSSTSELIEKVETRSKIKTFLFGSDYKNLGALRSKLVTTANHIQRLQRALASTTDQMIIAELQEQIDILEQVNSAAQNFVKENESKFSLFGWLVKLFN